MIPVLCSLALLHNDGLPTVNNLKEVSPVNSHAKIKDFAQELGRALYVPDDTARGYELNEIQTVIVPADPSFPQLNKRTATRLTFTNKYTSGSFDVFQVPSTADTSTSKQVHWILGKGLFEFHLTKHHTLVYDKFGQNDVFLAGTLISEPSAKILLSKFVRIAP